MIHDKEWLDPSGSEAWGAKLGDEYGYDAPNNFQYSRYAEDYHEHMMRWRSVSKAPKLGQWIEVLCNELGDIRSITYGSAKFRETDLGWRPAMPLPEGIKES